MPKKKRELDDREKLPVRYTLNKTTRSGSYSFKLGNL
jgi:hypothetical protein